jgi:signal transduction histidine kinase
MAANGGWHAAVERAEFARATRAASAQRNRGFLLLGAALIVVFSVFDVMVEPIAGQVLRDRLSNNSIILTMVLSAALVLSVPRFQRHVFSVLFGLVVCVLAGQAYLLGTLSLSPGRLAFHYLAVLVLTMLAIQWFWQWQMAVTAIALLLYALAAPFNHPDFAFYIVSLSGSAALAIVFAHVFVGWRYQQFVTDLRLRDANEQATAQAAQVAAKNAELTDLLYVLSHDLRAPLINLEGFSHALADTVGQLDELLSAAAAGAAGEGAGRVAEMKQDIAESLHFIRQGVDRMGVLVGGILQLSRLDSKPQQVERVDLDQLVQTVLPTFQYQLSQRQIAVNVGHLPIVVGDSVRLSQVISNLIDNAIKYMKPEGPARIDVRCERQPGLDVVSVRDTGVGIRPEDHAKVFRLFARLANNGTPGEGIGLAAVKKIVEQRGGMITVESEPGQGSVFRFTLPHREL